MGSYMKNEEGFTLISVILIMVLLSILGAGLISSNLLENKTVHSLEDQKQALYLAQAGVEYAVYQLKQDPTWRINDYIKILGNGQFLLTVSEVSEDELKIISTGTVGRVNKTLEAGGTYSVGTSKVAKVLGEYMALGGSTMYFNSRVNITKGNLRANGDINFNAKVDTAPDVQVISHGTVVDNGKNNTNDVSNADLYGIPQPNWTVLLDQTDKFLDWDSDKRLSDLDFIDGKVNYIDGDMSLNKSQVGNFSGILVINGNLWTNSHFDLSSDDGLIIFVKGDVVFNAHTELTNVAIYASGNIDLNASSYIEGGIYSDKEIRANAQTELALETIPLQSAAENLDTYFHEVETVIEGEDNFDLTYWNER